MNILYVITGLRIGGAERQLINLSDCLSLNNNIIIVNLDSTPCILPDNQSIKVINLSGNKTIFDSFKLVIKLSQIIKLYKPDIVHAHMFHAILISRITHFFSPNTVHISSSHSINEMHNFRMLCYRITDSLTDWSTNVSESSWKEYIKNKAWPLKKSSFLKNGIDCVKFQFNSYSRALLRGSLNVKTSTKIILAIGRLVEEKDYHLMLNSFSEALKIESDLLLIIIGSGNLHADLINYSNQLKINENVLFLGTQTNVSEWLSACDLFILTSKFESFGLVVAEAMACERVVLAVKSGEVENIIGDFGFIADSRESKELSNLILKIIRLDDSVLSEIGLQARKRIIEFYSIDKISKIWLDLYTKLITQN